MRLGSPPWPNASATRSSSYETFDPYDLWQLDIPALLGEKPALVAVWLTNRVKVRTRLSRSLLTGPHLARISAVPPSRQGQALPSLVRLRRCRMVLGQDRGGDRRAGLAARDETPALLRRCALLDPYRTSAQRAHPRSQLTSVRAGLLVGRYIPKGAKQDGETSSIPSDKVFLSTPIGHSRKPYTLGTLMSVPDGTRGPLG